MAALHYCIVEWPGHHKLASAGSDNECCAQYNLQTLLYSEVCEYTNAKYTILFSLVKNVGPLYAHALY